MVMPQMNGMELAGRLQSWQPGMRVLYMSGHGHRVVEEGMVLLPKPFAVEALIWNVRAVLDAPL